MPDDPLLAHGFAGQLAAAPSHLIEGVPASYRTAHLDVHSSGTAEQTVMFTRALLHKPQEEPHPATGANIREADSSERRNTC